LIRADQKTFKINKLEVKINICKVVMQLAVIILFKNYLVYILLDVVAIVVQNLIISNFADKDYSFIRRKEDLKPEERKEIFSDISSIFLYKVAWSLLNGTDNILMSIICGTVYVGLYSNYFTITNNLETFIALVFTSLSAGVGNLVATSTFEKKYATFKSMQMVSFWICGIVTTCLLFLTQDFIELWFGKELVLDNITLIAIVINVFFSTCMRPVWTFREGTGMYKQIRYIMFVTAIINLILSIVLGKRIGVAGIIFATSISKLTTYFWYEPNILFKKFFQVKPINYYLQYIINTAILLGCVGLCYIPIHKFERVSIINWFIKAFICLIIVNAIYFMRYYKTSEFTDIMIKVKSIIRKK
jgi:O-antigen/teichoic acid export membrane protein